MKKWILMPWLIISILTSNIMAGENAAKLTLGDLAPFTGILVKEERMESLIKAEKARPLLEAKIDAQGRLVDFHKGVAKDARVQLSEERFKAFWTNSGYFILGIVITGFAFKVNNKIQDM